jgi:hypothetical protein
MTNTQCRRSRAARFSRLALAALVLSGILLSCSDEPNATGISLIPDSLRIGTIVAAATGDTTIRTRIGGNAANILAGKSGTYEARALMEFLLPSYNAAAVIDSAVVTMRVRYLFPDTTGDLGFEAHAMNRTWSSTTFRWDSAAGSYDAASAGAFLKTVTPQDTIIRFLLDTALVRAWWQAGNVSLQLVPSPASNVIAGFSNILNSTSDDTRPELVVSYHDTTADSLTIVRRSPRVVFVATDDLLGPDPGLYVQAGVARRALFRFDSLAVPPLASITSAVFEVAVDGANSRTNGYSRDSLYVHLLRKNAEPYDSLALQILCTPVTEGGQKYFRGDIRAIVQQWISREPNLGLLVRAFGDFTTLDKFALHDRTAPAALQPKIRITYTLLPP